MPKLDKEELEILEAFEHGDIKSIPDKKVEMEKHKEYAASTFRQEKRVNIRISTRDLNALKKRTLAEGISYQSLITSILHKYLDGRLIEQIPNKAVQRTRKASR